MTWLPVRPALRIAALLVVPLLMIGIHFEARAQAREPIVEIDLSPDIVNVGEPVTLRVTVFVPTWFARPPEFPSFEIPNAVVRQPPNLSRPTSRRVDGETWSGVTRSFEIYPLLPAAFRLDSQPVDVAYAQPGSDPLRVKAPTGGIVFSARVPRGAEGLDPYVAGTRLELSREIEGDLDALAVGDALVVTFSAELEGLPALFLPEIFPGFEAPGVSVYPEQPTIEEAGTARRSERVTLIFNAGGSFTLPAVSIDWWDTASGAIHTASLPALSFAVEGPPLDSLSEAGQGGPAWRAWSSVLALMVVLVVVAPRALRRVIIRARQRRKAYEASEPFAWACADRALARGQSAAAYHALLLWHGRLPGTGSLQQFAECYGSPELARELDTLRRRLYTPSGTAPDHGRLRDGLRQARRQCLATMDCAAATLPALNP